MTTIWYNHNSCSFCFCLLEFLTHGHTILPNEWLLGNVALQVGCIFVSMCTGLQTLWEEKNSCTLACCALCTVGLYVFNIMELWMKYSSFFSPLSSHLCCFRVFRLVKVYTWICVFRDQGLEQESNTRSLKTHEMCAKLFFVKTPFLHSFALSIGTLISENIKSANILMDFIYIVPF